MSKESFKENIFLNIEKDIDFNNIFLESDIEKIDDDQNYFSNFSLNEHDFNDSFDVDDIVRKIDAKIAELEKEEAMNNQNRVDDNNMNNIINNQEAQKINNNNLEQIINNQQQSNISNNPVNTGNAISSQSNNINNSNVNNNTDDEFFDDFFE